MTQCQALLAALVLLGTAHAAPAQQSQNDDGSRSDAAEHPAREATGDADQRATPAAARDFTPSEQLGADSAVSFPVDI